MEFLERADESAFVWLNSWVGRFSLLDRIVELTVGDYFVPLTMSLLLLGLWFAGHSNAQREHNQLGVMTAILSVAVVNLIVELFNRSLLPSSPFRGFGRESLVLYANRFVISGKPGRLRLRPGFGCMDVEQKGGVDIVGAGCSIQSIQDVRRCFLSTGRDWRSSRWGSLCSIVWLPYAYLQAHTAAGAAISQGSVSCLTAEGELVERFGVLQTRLFS